jgi:hypothetical protein
MLSVLYSSTSAIKLIASSNRGIPSPVLADKGMKGICPPHSSGFKP